jgi:RecA-family ATPase
MGIRTSIATVKADGFNYLTTEEYDKCWKKAEESLKGCHPDRLCVTADWRKYSLENLPLEYGEEFHGQRRDKVRVIVNRQTGERWVVRAHTLRYQNSGDCDYNCRRRLENHDGIIGELSPIAPVKFTYEIERELDKLKEEFEEIVDNAAMEIAAEEDKELEEFAKNLEIIRKRELLETSEIATEMYRASEFAGKPVPLREWVVPDLVPHRNVTGLSGDGGTGKSLLALQLAVGVAHSGYWLEMAVEKKGPVIFFSAEDETDEIHRRLVDICATENIDLKALDDLHILPMAGLNALLASHDRHSGSMKKTELWIELVRVISLFKPALLIIDTQADTFGGDEVIRRQVREFIGILRGLAFNENVAVLLLSHPSLTGLGSGTGTSGSTGWNNSLRSRLYFERIFADDRKTEIDPNLRLLSNKKANYAARGTEIRVRWENGVFEPDGEASGTDKRSTTQVAEQVFMELLGLFESQGRNVSPNESKTYAPTVFAAHPNAKGITKRMFALAMERLFQANRIRIEVSGPPSRKRERLVTV